MTFTVTSPPERREVPRDGLGRPLIVPKTGGKPVAHKRTTTFIDVLEDKSSIEKWKSRGTMIGTLRFPEVAKPALGYDETLRLAERGALDDPEQVKQAKQNLNALAERVFDMAGYNDKREKGTYLHKLSEYVDAGIPLPSTVQGDDLEDMTAYMMATMNLTVLRIEQFVVVNELPTAGTPDRVSVYDGRGPDMVHLNARLITDLKTGDISYGGLKMAAQLAVYARGEQYDFTKFPVDTEDKKAFTAWKKTEFDPELAASAYSPLPEDISRDWGLIINLRPGSGVATLHWVDLELGWRAALMAKEIHAMRSLSRKALRAA